MPDRFLPSSRGIIDGFIYMAGAFYISHGFAWFALAHPGRLAGIPWFHETLNDNTVGWWFLIGGLAVIVGELFARIPWVRTLVMNITVMIPLIPGLIFLLAWAAGYYPRGVLVASTLVGLAVLSSWLIIRSGLVVKGYAEEMQKTRPTED